MQPLKSWKFSLKKQIEKNISERSYMEFQLEKKHIGATMIVG